MRVAGETDFPASWLRGLLIVAVVLLCACGEEPATVIADQAWGNRYHVTLPRFDGDQAELRRAIQQELSAIDREVSTYRDDSWVMGFNRGESLEPVVVPKHAWAMVRVAERVHRESGGALDITAGPLVELWGFGPSRGTDEADDTDPPSEMQIATTLLRVGMDKLTIDADAQTLAKQVPGVELDFSALAKGYAVDRIAALLDERGHANYLIAFGGEVRARGHPAPQTQWALDTPHPLRPTITLGNQAAATSGGAYRSRDTASGIATHLIDPRSGRAVTDTQQTVTVIAERCVEADAWATALSLANVERPSASRGIEVITSYSRR